jgi:hypothetical protein
LAAVRLAKVVLDADLRAPCDALVLYPESCGNMHRFTAATPCAVLDVLGPPYSKRRDCTYYQDIPYPNHDAPSKPNPRSSQDLLPDLMKKIAIKDTDYSFHLV